MKRLLDCGEKPETKALLSAARLPSVKKLASVVLRRNNRIYFRQKQKIPLLRISGVPTKSVDFVGKSRNQKRCFQPLDFPRQKLLPRSSRGKAIASGAE